MYMRISHGISLTSIQQLHVEQTFKNEHSSDSSIAVPTIKFICIWNSYFCMCVAWMMGCGLLCFKAQWMHNTIILFGTLYCKAGITEVELYSWRRVKTAYNF